MELWSKISLFNKDMANQIETSKERTTDLRDLNSKNEIRPTSSSSSVDNALNAHMENENIKTYNLLTPKNIPPFSTFSNQNSPKRTAASTLTHDSLINSPKPIHIFSKNSPTSKELNRHEDVNLNMNTIKTDIPSQINNSKNNKSDGDKEDSVNQSVNSAYLGDSDFTINEQNSDQSKEILPDSNVQANEDEERYETTTNRIIDDKQMDIELTSDEQNSNKSKVILPDSNVKANEEEFNKNLIESSETCSENKQLTTSIENKKLIENRSVVLIDNNIKQSDEQLKNDNAVTTDLGIHQNKIQEIKEQQPQITPSSKLQNHDFYPKIPFESKGSNLTNSFGNKFKKNLKEKREVIENVTKVKEELIDDKKIVKEEVIDVRPKEKEDVVEDMTRVKEEVDSEKPKEKEEVAEDLTKVKKEVDVEKLKVIEEVDVEKPKEEDEAVDEKSNEKIELDVEKSKEKGEVVAEVTKVKYEVVDEKPKEKVKVIAAKIKEQKERNLKSKPFTSHCIKVKSGEVLKYTNLPADISNNRSKSTKDIKILVDVFYPYLNQYYGDLPKNNLFNNDTRQISDTIKLKNIHNINIKDSFINFEKQLKYYNTNKPETSEIKRNKNEYNNLYDQYEIRSISNSKKMDDFKQCLNNEKENINRYIKKQQNEFQKSFFIIDKYLTQIKNISNKLIDNEKENKYLKKQTENYSSSIKSLSDLKAFYERNNTETNMKLLKENNTLKMTLKYISYFFNSFELFGHKIFNILLNNEMLVNLTNRKISCIIGEKPNQSFTKLFMEKFEVVGLLTKRQEIYHNVIASKFSRLEKENQEYKEEIECLNKEKTSLSGELVKQNNFNKKKTTQFENLKEQAVSIREKNVELNNELQTLRHQNSNLNDQLLEEKNKNENFLLSHISQITIELADIKTKLLNELSHKTTLNQKIEELKHQNSIERQKLQDQIDQNRELQKQINSLKGDESLRITNENVSFLCYGKSNIDAKALQIEQVDDLTMVELQNAIKNVLICLNIPFDKISCKITKISLYLKFEQPALWRFVNRAYYQLNEEYLDINDLTYDIFDQYMKTHDFDKMNNTLDEYLTNLFKEFSSSIN